VPHEFDSPEYGATEYDRSISALDSYIGRLLKHVGDDTVVILTGDHGECVGELPEERTLLPYFLDKFNLRLVDVKRAQVMDDTADLAAEEPLLHQFATEMSMISQSGKRRIGLRQRFLMSIQLLRIAVSGYRIRAKKGLKGGGEFLGILKEKLLLVLLAIIRGNPDAAQFQLVKSSLSMHILQHGYHIYDYLQNVPIVFVKKGLFPEGKRVDAELRHIDLLPTLIEALSLDAPSDGYDGSSYFPYILNGGGEDRPIYLEATGAVQGGKVFLIRGVRRDNRKIAFAPNEEGAPVEYYDLTADSQELNNLAEIESEEAAKLRQEADAIAASFSGREGQKLTAEENLELIKRLEDLGYM
jgi:arylsulfatase A-like enzyme